MRGFRLVQALRRVGLLDGLHLCERRRAEVFYKIPLQAMKLRLDFEQGAFDIRHERPRNDVPDNSLRVNDKSETVATRLRAATGGHAVQIGHPEIQIFQHRRAEVDAEKTPRFVRPVVLADRFSGERDSLRVALIEPAFFFGEEGRKHHPGGGKIGRVCKKNTPVAPAVIGKANFPLLGGKSERWRRIAYLRQVRMVDGHCGLECKSVIRMDLSV